MLCLQCQNVKGFDGTERRDGRFSKNILAIVIYSAP